METYSENLRTYDPVAKAITKEDVEQQLGQSYEMLKNFPTAYPVEMVAGVIQMIGIIVILFLISPINAILVAFFVPFFTFISNRYGDKLGENGKKTVDSMHKCRNYLSDLVSMSNGERFRNVSLFLPIGTILQGYSKNKKRQTKTEAVFSNFLSYAFLNLLVNVSLIVSGFQVIGGLMTVGSLYAVQLYVSRFWTPVESFVACYKEYASTKNVMAEFLDFLTVKKCSYETHDIPEIQLIDYQSTDGSGNPLHQPLNETLRSGTIHFLMGDNGAGKTSLVLAILGLSSRYQGEIRFPGFGHNNNFAYLVDKSVYSEFYRQPVPFGSSAGQLKIAQLDMGLEEEKDVYIFDEPTNFLDTGKKEQVRRSLTDLRDKGKLVIVVSHDGEIIEENDHLIRLKKIDR